MCAFSSPKAPAPPPAQPDPVLEEKRKQEEETARAVARTTAANANGRRGLINPLSGALGVVGGLEGGNKSLF